jgi:hypothetical protein
MLNSSDVNIRVAEFHVRKMFMEINKKHRRILPMNAKLGPLLIISMLAMLSGGCGTDSSPTPENLYPLFPVFSPDPSPAPPNYYWLISRPYTTDDSARDVFVPPKSG